MVARETPPNRLAISCDGVATRVVQVLGVPDLGGGELAAGAAGAVVQARIDDQRLRDLVTGYPGPAARIAKRSEAVCAQSAVSEWLMAARRRFRGRHHEASPTRSARWATSSRGTNCQLWPMIMGVWTQPGAGAVIGHLRPERIARRDPGVVEPGRLRQPQPAHDGL